MKRTFLLLLILASSALATFGGPARRGFIRKTLADGTAVAVRMVGDEWYHAFADADDNPYEATADGRLVPTTWAAVSEQHAASRIQVLRAGDRRDVKPYRYVDFPTRGDIHGIVILAAFKDVPFSLPDDSIRSLLTARYNGENYSEPLSVSDYSEAYSSPIGLKGTIVGSARDYFRDQSFGKFRPTFDVVGPVTLDSCRAYYGGNTSSRPNTDRNPRLMAKQACQKAHDAGLVDFSRYDNDGDGYVDYVYIVYAGSDEAQFGGDDCVWAHAWTLASPLSLDSKKISRYACSAELLIDTKIVAGIGTFCHEFGHVIGLPDFYNTVSSCYGEDAFAMDYWSIMDYGQYNLEGFVPAAYTAFERFSLGWMELPALTEPADVTLAPLESSGEAYRTFVAEDDTTAFYIFENNQKEKWNKYAPTRGLMITQVNYRPASWTGNTVNNGSNPHRYYMVPANDVWHALDADGYEYSDYNPTEHLYGRDNHAFTLTSKPASVTSLGVSVDKPVTDITLCEDGSATFRFMGGNAIGVPTAGGPCTIYALDGQRVADDASFQTLPSGIYLVRRNGEVHKVVKP